MPFVDQDVAAQLEGVWALELVNYAETLKRLGLRPSAATEPIGDGVCVYTSPDLPVNRAAGMGLTSPVTAGQMEEIEHFFADREVPTQLDLCPLADPSLLELAAERRYHVVRFLDVLSMDLPSQDPLPAVPLGVEVRAITADEAEIWAQAVASGFAATDGLDESDANVILARAAAHSPGVVCYLATVGGQPAGGGAMILHNRLAALFSSSTRLPFRGRGIQNGLVVARLKAAASAGCTTASVLATSGSVSHRNLERAGFRVAYTRATLQR
jgi:hypothetical protein